MPGDSLAPDVHPYITERLPGLMTALRVAHPRRVWSVADGHRSIAEQRKAYNRGTTKLSPDHGRYSLHLYRPSLAVDLWAWDGEGPATGPTLYPDRRPDAIRHRLQLRLDPASLRECYWPMHAIAAELGLEALRAPAWSKVRRIWTRGTWDGPHLQIPKRERIRALQSALLRAGHDPGALDGLYGRHTKRALADFGAVSGVRWEVSWRQSRLMPCHPDAWALLHDG